MEAKKGIFALFRTVQSDLCAVWRPSSTKCGVTSALHRGHVPHCAETIFLTLQSDLCTVWRVLYALRGDHRTMRTARTPHSTVTTLTALHHAEITARTLYSAETMLAAPCSSTLHRATSAHFQGLCVYFHMWLSRSPGIHQMFYSRSLSMLLKSCIILIQ